MKNINIFEDYDRAKKFAWSQYDLGKYDPYCIYKEKRGHYEIIYYDGVEYNEATDCYLNTKREAIKVCNDLNKHYAEDLQEYLEMEQNND